MQNSQTQKYTVYILSFAKKKCNNDNFLIYSISSVCKYQYATIGITYVFSHKIVISIVLDTAKASTK